MNVEREKMRTYGILPLEVFLIVRSGLYILLLDIRGNCIKMSSFPRYERTIQFNFPLFTKKKSCSFTQTAERSDFLVFLEMKSNNSYKTHTSARKWSIMLHVTHVFVNVVQASSVIKSRTIAKERQALVVACVEHNFMQWPFVRSFSLSLFRILSVCRHSQRI